jgi:hypothetical protein
MSESYGDAYTKNSADKAVRPVEVAEAEEPEEEPEQPPAEDQPWALNPNAIFDSMANLDSIKLGVPFPKSVLAVAMNDAETVALQSLDDKGYIIVQALTHTTKRKGRKFTFKEITDAANKFTADYVKNDLATLHVGENSASEKEVRTYYRAGFVNKEGQQRYLSISFSLWRNERDQRLSIYLVLLECDLNIASEFQTLTDRIFTSLADI